MPSSTKPTAPTVNDVDSQIERAINAKQDDIERKTKEIEAVDDEKLATTIKYGTDIAAAQKDPVLVRTLTDKFEAAIKILVTRRSALEKDMDTLNIQKQSLQAAKDRTIKELDDSTTADP